MACCVHSLELIAGSSDRESAAGDLNLSDGPCENGPCIQVDSDSVSLVSSHHNMYQCELLSYEFD